MSIFRKLGVSGLLAALVIGGVVSCGGDTNNDQGTSFTALGFVTVDDEGKIQPDVFDAGRQVVLNKTTSSYTGTSEIAYIALQNNLCAQTLRTVRVECDYTASGSSLAIPSDATNVSFVMSGTGNCPTETSSSSSSESSEDVGQGNILYVAFDLISSDVLSYLSVNQNSLPELPFRMTATCRAVAVSGAGDVYISNDLYYPVEFVERLEVSGIVTSSSSSSSSSTSSSSITN